MCDNMNQSSVIDHIQDSLQEGDTTSQRPKSRCGQKARRVDLKSQEAEAEEASETVCPD